MLDIQGLLFPNCIMLMLTSNLLKASAWLFSFCGTCSKVTQSSDVISFSAYL